MHSLDETLIYIENLNAGYVDKSTGKTKLILKDVNMFEYNVIREGHDSTGQTIAVLGRSGRGKSTFFKVLAGLLKAFSGKLLINDIDSGLKEQSKIISEGDVGFVDQKYTLFRHKTVMQICEYAVKRYKKKYFKDGEGKTEATWKEYKTEVINSFLTEWGLMEHKDKYPHELSGGQRQRTALIEQMLANKHFMILDEPFSGLDVGNIEKVKESFKKISEAHEMNTVIFSTHDISLAVELADSIYIIGFPEGVKDYSTIVKHYDLKKMGIAWTKYGDEHRKLVSEIKEVMLNS